MGRVGFSPAMAQVSVIQVGVTDMQRDLAFWRDGLGFEVEEAGERFSTLRHEGAVLLLAKAEAPGRADYPREAQVLVDFASRDIPGDLARLAKAGAALVHDAPQPCPVGTFAAFRDPSGNVHELLHFGGSP